MLPSCGRVPTLPHTLGPSHLTNPGSATVKFWMRDCLTCSSYQGRIQDFTKRRVETRDTKCGVLSALGPIRKAGGGGRGRGGGGGGAVHFRPNTKSGGGRGGGGGCCPALQCLIQKAGRGGGGLLSRRGGRTAGGNRSASAYRVTEDEGGSLSQN